MSVGVFTAVLFAALLHASWNASIKVGDDKFQGMVLLSVAHGVIGLAMIMYFPAPDPQAWGLLALSVAFHVAYKSFLTAAYQRGDLSRVYPIARGTAPMLVLIASFYLLDDQITTRQIVGVTLIGIGILMMARGVFTSGESRALIPFALGSALGTAGYSLAVGWLFFLDAFLFTLWGIWWRGIGIIPTAPRSLAIGLGAGAMSVGAYWIVVWAMTVAPIALVTGLRETSVMFAVLIGVVFLGEGADRGKLIAAMVILGGVILTRI